MSTIEPHAVTAGQLAECDLVMKGGITSGIVYPPVVQILRRKYRFKSIGGTSAGAIAAALTAAAEHGRATGGFEKLQGVQDDLGRPGFIVDLFKATPAGRPLLEAGLQLLRDKREAEAALGRGGGAGASLSRVAVIRLADAAARRFFRESSSRGGLIGATAGVVAALVLATLFVVPAAASAHARGLPDPFGRLGWAAAAPALLLSVGLGLLGAFLGRRVGAAVQVVRYFTRVLPQDRYGIVQGHAPSPAAGAPAALTDYLAAKIDHLAGVTDGRPLTFGMLDPDGDGKGVELKCVATNVSQGRPYVLPFDGGDFFLFKRSEFAELFPANVVEQMVTCAGPLSSVRPPDGFFRVPRSADLPVVVAMRMSLSFPVLIAAVPLYTVARSAFARRRGRGEVLVLAEDDLQRNWFSDGGVCSNFPIHFFDAWLPGRPTFGINLTYRAETAFTPDRQGLRPEYQSAAGVDEAAGTVAEREPAGAAGDAGESVWLPRANEHRAADPEWNAVTSLTGFLGGVFAAAQNHRDTLQAGLPSYRERIVRINLAPDEGGMNLDMPEPIVRRIVEKGEQAGGELDRFDFDDHLWTRLLVLMAEIERNVGTLPTKLDRACELLEARRAGGGQSYPRDPAWCAAALRRLELMRNFVETWGGTDLPPFEGFQPRRPKPSSVLRVTPNV